MQWLTGIAALAALPLTAVIAFWPVIRDRGRLTKLERVAQIADIASLSDHERLLLTAYRRRLTRQVFVRTMLRRRWFDLITGLYGVIGGPSLLILYVVLLALGLVKWPSQALDVLFTGVVATMFGIFVLGLRSYRMRQQARRLLKVYRSPTTRVGASALRQLVRRSSSREPGREGIE